MAKANKIAAIRFQARVPRETHALLKCAAAIQGRTLSNFVARTAEIAARKVIEDADTSGDEIGADLVS